MKNADLFKDTFGTYATEIWSMPENDFLKWLNEDAKPKTGHWISGICDKCGYDWGKDAPIANVPHFCPNCGACTKDCRTLDEFIEDSKKGEE